MKPRFASSVVNAHHFAQQVFRCTEDEWQRLPPQWRGFVLHRMQQGLTVDMVLKTVASGERSAAYDPQATFDAFQGLQPA